MHLEEAVEKICSRYVDDLKSLVDISSPSGDAQGMERMCEAVLKMMPEAYSCRIPSSTPGFPEDLLCHLNGEGSGKLLLLTHFDTVIPHEQHKPLRSHAGRLSGTGTLDMKGGVVIAAGIMRTLCYYPELYERVTFLGVSDEENRVVPMLHPYQLDDYQVVLNFEEGARINGKPAVVTKRKGSGHLVVHAYGKAAHAGKNPDGGASALLALSKLAPVLYTLPEPGKSDEFSCVPTIFKSGDVYNRIPDYAELICDIRGYGDICSQALGLVPQRLSEIKLKAHVETHLPSMDSTESSSDLLELASAILGEKILTVSRSSSSDSSYFTRNAISIDGLGPFGKGDHTPDEYIASEVAGQVRLALTLAMAALSMTGA